MNYADMVLQSDKQSIRDTEFEQLSRQIANLEFTFEQGCDTRRALFEARRAVGTAKFLNRIQENDPKCGAV